MEETADKLDSPDWLPATEPRSESLAVVVRLLSLEPLK